MRRVLLLLAIITACAPSPDQSGASNGSGADTSIPLRDSAASSSEANEETCRYTAPKWECWVGHGIVVEVEAFDDTSPRSDGQIFARLAVTPVRGPGVKQTLKAADMYARLEESDIKVRDMDGDGYRDLLVQRKWGHPNNDGQHTWRYRPDVGRFALDLLLSNETNVTPDSTGCVHTSGWLGGGDTIESRYCLVGDAWVERWQKRSDNEMGVGIIETTRERRGDSLVVVKVDTLRDGS